MASVSMSPSMSKMQLEGVSELEQSIVDLKAELVNQRDTRDNENTLTDVVDLMRVMIEELRAMRSDLGLINQPLPPSQPVPQWPQQSPTMYTNATSGAASQLMASHTHGGSSVV